jgi:ADP-ribose pyrophosphatase YjhB (NUDIX family)
MNTQYFVDELPVVPEASTQNVVPITQANVANPGWKPVLDGDRIVGFRNPGLGQFIHSAVVDGEKSMYDLMLWDDGPIGEDGLATPGTVIAPIEKLEDGYYVHCFWQWRPALSTWVLTLPGGFASFVGESADTVAKREAMEEGGFTLLSASTAASSANRANVRTLVNVGYAEFVQNGKPISNDNEKIVGKFAIRIDKFPWTPDRFTNEAVWLAVMQLGLVRAKPIETVEDAIAALKKALIE